MTRPVSKLCSSAVLVALCGLLGSCDSAPMDDANASVGASARASPAVADAQRKHHNPEEAEQQLVGTWLREHQDKGVRSRRLLRLDADGSFEEKVRLTDAAGVVSEHLHAGTWLFDGTNLKRKYTLMNGQPPSRLNLPFATFQIELPSRNELVGTDHIHKHRVHYRRVQPETEL